MKIVIPLAGFGERFQKAGYKVIKPLIEIAGKPMIQHVMENFPGEEFIFICNEDHLKEKRLEAELKKLSPNSLVIGIKPHRGGPVDSFLAASDFIPENEEIIISYCDVKLKWDYQDFLNTVRKSGAHGSLPCLTGFHQVFLSGMHFCTIITDENQKPIEIKPKFRPFTGDEKTMFADSGTYYFKKGSIAKKYANKLVESGASAGSNERYFSSVFDRMIKDGLTITLYPIKKYFSLGTPQHVKEYELADDEGHNKA